MILVVTGSVGSGKSTIARALADKLKLKYLDVNLLIEQNNLRGKYLDKFDSYEVDVKKLNLFLVKLIKKSKFNLIIDSHLGHYLNPKYVDYCIVCKCDLSVLKKRLFYRGYSKLKIRENLDCEIFDVCLIEAKENKHGVIVVSTSKKKIKNCVKEIIDQISQRF
jgi:adenylate kinase